MSNQRLEPRDSESKQSPTGLFKTAFGFFGGVLDSIKTDELLRVVWGVEVLLFVILAFMILFGDLSSSQRFILAVFIVVSVVSTLLISSWRSHGPQSSRDRSIEESRASTSKADLVEQAHRCLALLTEIRDANRRNLQRSRAGDPHWDRLARDTYNRICRRCHERRLGEGPRDDYLDAVCAEPDVATVCDRKWDLGEALELYRTRMNRLRPPPNDHEELELLIRRSVIQPDCSPAELDDAVTRAIQGLAEIG